MSKLTVVLLNNLPASAFGEGVKLEDVQSKQYVAITDGQGYLIAGINKDGDSKEEIEAHFREQGLDADMPLALIAMLNGVPFIDAADVEGADIDEVYSVESDDE
ncbi:hypothetical protein smaasur_36 [Escherichia phage smaasur]|uniref:Uncharacterized protein n=1 Tax=Escherichia phage smaasur TaxID=2696444 RepID=A0A6B9X892_9CAUD|nr:hypothetical protein smaasur_36 [Escherichia phage smaasur]